MDLSHKAPCFLQEKLYFSSGLNRRPPGQRPLRNFFFPDGAGRAILETTKHQEEATMAIMDWDTLERTCGSCQKCALADTRHNVVFGVGPRDAEVMCIGEGPGENEDLQGEPFVGRGGKLLDDMLELIDLDRSRNVYIANIVKCRPPQNRDPLNTEQDACIGYLRNQVALIRPKIIV